MIPNCYQDNRPINTMAAAFLAAGWDKKMAEIAHMAKLQLRRSNLKPKTVLKWHRLGAIAYMVKN